MRVSESVRIGRGVEDVWDFVADPGNDVRWCPKVKSVQTDGPGRWKAVHKPVPLRPPVVIVVEEVEREAPRRLKLREEDAASVFEVEYRLAPSADGTVFTQCSDFHWKRLPRAAQKVLAHGVRRDIRRQLRRLRRVLEAG